MHWFLSFSFRNSFLKKGRQNKNYPTFTHILVICLPTGQFWPLPKRLDAEIWKWNYTIVIIKSFDQIPLWLNRSQNNHKISLRDQSTELFVATTQTQKPLTSWPSCFSWNLHLLPLPTQPSAAMTLAPLCSPWPRGTSCSSQAAGRVGSASWSWRTNSSARASRPTTLRSKLWPWIRRRTASSAAHRRETSGWL